MKIIISILKAVIFILFILDIFYFGIANGSGHEIPIKTNLSIFCTGFFLAILFFLLSYISKNKFK